MKVYIKDFAFDFDVPAQKDMAKKFFDELSRKYDLAFDFRSSDEEALIVEPRPDVPLEDLKKEAKREQQFEEGRYEYIFARPVKESLINSIPNVIEKTDAGMNGGVVLSLPLMPDMLPSYDLRPHKLPPEAYVKLTMTQLSDVDKGLFLSELQKKSDDSALDVGMFVQDYLAGRTVSTEYFFGKLRTVDFGQIFKNYAQNKDVETLTFEVKEEKKKPIKSKVTFEDAENFLIEMITS